MMNLYIEFLLFLVLTFASIISFKSKHTTKRHTLPPGPAGYPLVGCLPEMVRNKPAFRWIHHRMRALDTKIASFRVGRVHVIAVASPELSRQFLQARDAVFASRPECMSARIPSNGFLSAVLAPAGGQWKKMRRVMASEVLSAGVHRWLHPKRCEEADHLVRYVYNSSARNGVVNVREAARLYCGGLIRKLVFGEGFLGPGSEDGGPGFEEREHMDGLFTILNHLYGFCVADYVPFLEVFDFDGHKRIVSEAMQKVRKYHDARIDGRVEMWRNGVRTKKEDILDVLITLKDSNDDPLLSVQEIKAQVCEIFLAAIDNPSNAVEWAMAEMINEPRLINLATKELDKIVGRKRLVQESDLSQLKYIKACVKEAFRLHPVAPFNLPHVSIEDIVVDGYFIPKGSHVLLSRIGLGRNPRVWGDDLLQFKPERHIVNDRVVLLHDPDLNLLSFSIGRRGCPGTNLGSTMATMLLARLVQGFTWTSPSIDLAESHADLSLANPLVVGVIPRLEPQLYRQILCKEYNYFIPDGCSPSHAHASY